MTPTLSEMVETFQKAVYNEHDGDYDTERGLTAVIETHIVPMVAEGYHFGAIAEYTRKLGQPRHDEVQANDYAARIKREIMGARE